jgi:predicted lipoprotein with Yx(FWY)xxD motif
VRAGAFALVVERRNQCTRSFPRAARLVARLGQRLKAVLEPPTRKGHRMRTFLILVTLAAVIAVPASASRAQSSVAVHASKYGRVLFDGRGFALYAFTRDPRGRSTCAGACAKNWPPYIVSHRPVAGVGAKRSLLGTIRRSDGRVQATYARRPLYYYVNDKKPRQILCQNVSLFGGIWLVVRPDGRLVH